MAAWRNDAFLGPFQSTMCLVSEC